MCRHHSEADCLSRPEDEHSAGRGHKQPAATGFVTDGGRGDSPAEVPDREDAVDKKLNSRTTIELAFSLATTKGQRCLLGNTNSIKHLAQIVADKPIARPLREECNCDNDAHPFAVSGSGE